MLRPLWLALLALGLWASLIPQVRYASPSSGDPVGGVLIAWPGWGVQQELGNLSGTVGTFRIWMSAMSGTDLVTVHASLIEASTSEVIRQTTVDVDPAYIPTPRTISFPGYAVAPGQRLLLQLQVADFERVAVVYRLASPRPDVANVMLNGKADAGEGPLAFSHEWSSSGLRAAFRGESSEQVRLALALGFSILFVVAKLRVGLDTGRRAAALWDSMRSGDDHTRESTTLFGRALSQPWYPWLLVTIPILHFTATNRLHFGILDSIVVLALALVCISVAVVTLQFRLRDWHRASAGVAAAAAVFFAYGHIDRAFAGTVDERVMLSGSVMFAAAIAFAVTRTKVFRITRFLNWTCAILLLFPVIALVSDQPQSGPHPATDQPDQLNRLMEHLPSIAIAAGESPGRDIYHIVLDAYSRHDNLAGFDNSDFLRALEQRGFYVAREAASNYTTTLPALGSQLNMAYVHDYRTREVPRSSDALADHLNYNALAAFLKSHGYTYVHLESGYQVTNTSPLADVLVSFSPSGVLVCSRDVDGSNGVCGATNAGMSMSRFWREFAQTTALRAVGGALFDAGRSEPYDYWRPERTLKMFEFLAEPIDVGGPKYTFAHIVKPHEPATFDRFGNYISSSLSDAGFADDHDPTVPDAYTGQLIYINQLVLRMIDDLLAASASDPPIIVITGDHGKSADDGSGHGILAAFHLPGGGAEVLYPSISSVNHFRVILDYYFQTQLGLLIDQAG